mmetsp:Transcript_50798/g.120975  ORF Transcript_50798/g.120975 Transcript_50798/m.120975 type:complete len:205 (+) Transcript_50798:378-992(+)
MSEAPLYATAPASQARPASGGPEVDQSRGLTHTASGWREVPPRSEEGGGRSPPPPWWAYAHRYCTRPWAGLCPAGVCGQRPSSCAAEVAERSEERGWVRRETSALTRDDTARTSRAPAPGVSGQQEQPPQRRLVHPKQTLSRIANSCPFLRGLAPHLWHCSARTISFRTIPPLACESGALADEDDGDSGALADESEDASEAFRC